MATPSKIHTSINGEWKLIWPITPMTTSLTAVPPYAVVGADIALTSSTVGVDSGSTQFQYSIDDGVTWSDLGVPIAVDASGGAQTTHTSPGAAVYVYRARYLGNETFSGSVSNTVQVTVSTSVPTITTLATLPLTTVEITDPVALSVLVEGGLGENPTTGTVQFQSSPDQSTWTDVGTPIALTTDSTASTTDTPSALGAIHYQAVYSGATGFDGSTSNVQSLTVTTIATTTTLTVSPISVAIGGITTLTGDTTVGVGTLQFQYLNGVTWTDIGAAIAVDANGGASTTYTLTAAGTISFRAQYSGSGNYDPSTSSTKTCTAALPATSTTISANPTRVMPNAASTLTGDSDADIVASGGGVGSMTFQYKSGLSWYDLGTVTTAASGVGTISTGALTGGKTYRANWLGNAQTAASTSGEVAVSIMTKTNGTLAQGASSTYEWGAYTPSAGQVGSIFHVGTHTPAPIFIQQFKIMLGAHNNSFDTGYAEGGIWNWNGAGRGLIINGGGRMMFQSAGMHYETFSGDSARQLNADWYLIGFYRKNNEDYYSTAWHEWSGSMAPSGGEVYWDNRTLGAITSPFEHHQTHKAPGQLQYEISYQYYS